MQPETGTLAPYVPRALLARLARPIDVLAEAVDCTIVFADVSGFTRLSERLARGGKEGAEQLVDVINACFTALLAEAYGRGGSLLKFGGDAMVLLFDDQKGDQQHALRACCSAAEMRRTAARGRPDPRRRPQRGASDVGRRAHRPVPDVRRRRVPSRARDRWRGGDQVVALEAAASAGQILVSPDTARQLPRSSVGAPDRTRVPARPFAGRVRVGAVR